jgi:hypothetical protein
MSTTTSCRRDEVANCQPDRTIIVEQKTESSPADLLCGGEKQVMSEKQFLRDHSIYSAMSSWLFAIAGATNIGVLSVVSSKLLTAAEQGRPLFKKNQAGVEPVMGNKKYNNIAIGMTAFGAVCMAISNWLESKKVVTEWQLGAGKLQRKAAIAEEKAHAAQTDQNTSADTTSPAKSWVASVQAKASEKQGIAVVKA